MFPETEHATAKANGKPCDDCLDERSLFEDLDARLTTVQANQRTLFVAVQRIDWQTLIIVGMLAYVTYKVRNGAA